MDAGSIPAGSTILVSLARGRGPRWRPKGSTALLPFGNPIAPALRPESASLCSPDTMLALFKHFPKLQTELAHTSLCELPTSIELFASDELKNVWIKRDDLTAPEYGGNKVRKLEFLLADALKQDRCETLAFGFAGSNFAAATAFYARKLGLRSISMLLPQANASYLRDNLLLSVASEAELHERSSAFRLGLTAIYQSVRHKMGTKQWPYWIPAGGSSPLGIIGFVNAAYELQAQISAGELPCPAAIYLPMGSMGSVVGLGIGCAALGLDTDIIATRVVEERYANPAALRKLILKTVRYLRQGDDSFPKITPEQCRIRFRDDQYGEGYGVATAATVEATALAAQAGIELDVTYSAKGFAAMLADRRAGATGPVLFWNTHSSADVSGLIAEAQPSELPENLQRYFLNT